MTVSILGSTSAAPAFRPGQVLGETFVIRELIASGGMGEVYLASHVRLPGAYALKCLQPSLARDRGALDRFRREAEILALLRHPHVVQILDYGCSETGIPYMAMEFLSGCPLDRLIGPREHGERKWAMTIIEQVGSALDMAHTMGFIHRDLKPENVIVVDVPANTGDPLVKLIDFGISMPLRSESGTRTAHDGEIVGTPGFMAPEQAQGFSGFVDERCDQFSLAVLAYLLFAGYAPFSGTTPLETLTAVIKQEPFPLPDNPHAEAVRPVIMRALDKAPARRYGSVSLFVAALRDAHDSHIDRARRSRRSSRVAEQLQSDT